jgi:hypothetical protein
MTRPATQDDAASKRRFFEAVVDFAQRVWKDSSWLFCTFGGGMFYAAEPEICWARNDPKPNEIPGYLTSLLQLIEKSTAAKDAVNRFAKRCPVDVFDVSPEFCKEHGKLTRPRIEIGRRVSEEIIRAVESGATPEEALQRLSDLGEGPTTRVWVAAVVGDYYAAAYEAARRDVDGKFLEGLQTLAIEHGCDVGEGLRMLYGLVEAGDFDRGFEHLVRAVERKRAVRVGAEGTSQMLDPGGDWNPGGSQPIPDGGVQALRSFPSVVPRLSRPDQFKQRDEFMYELHQVEHKPLETIMKATNEKFPQAEYPCLKPITDPKTISQVVKDYATGFGLSWEPRKQAKKARAQKRNSA